METPLIKEIKTTSYPHRNHKIHYNKILINAFNKPNSRFLPLVITLLEAHLDNSSKYTP